MMDAPLRKLLTVLLIFLWVTSACGPTDETEEPQRQSGIETAPAPPNRPTAAPINVNPPGIEPSPPIAPAETQNPPSAPIDTAPGAEWTLLMYLDADDDILEEDIFIDLNEMELVGSTDEVQIVAQIDRYRGGFTGDGNWTETRRYFVTQDDDLEALASDEIENMGELDHGDPNTLAEFVAWGIQNYPAQRYALFLSDHGGGWTGGWSDPDPRDPSQLALVEIRDGIVAGLQEAGLEKLDVISFDACLMSQFEVFAAIYPLAKVGIASEEVIPAMGMAYTAFLERLVAEPEMDGRRLAEIVVETYIDEDMRILDDRQRGELFGPGSAAQIAAEINGDVTLSAIDLDALPALLAAVDSLSAALVNVDQAAVAEARTYTQSYTTIFGEGTPESFLDLGHFASMTADITGSPETASAANAVRIALKQALIAERHGSARPGSTGVTIFFPNSSLYQDWLEDYTYTTGGFTEISSWDDFLSYHYYGTPFNPQPGTAAVPPTGAVLTAPGAGDINLLPIEISADSVSSGETIQLNSQVSGSNIAYVFTFVGYYEELSGAVLVADMNFVYTEGTREIEGVHYPNFSGGPIDLEWEWTPVIYYLNDGNASGFALFEPDDYGAQNESPTYAVYGIWTYADGSSPDYAMVYFVDGEMRYAYAYSGEGGSGAPRQIKPAIGDQFTVLYTIYTQDETGQLQTTYEEGDTFTLGENRFTWEEVPAPAGSYVVGFVAMDFDGNLTYQVAPVEVR